jgi:sugar phosphate isomerase/epimerase
MLTRREFSTLALSALAWPKLLAQTANTVGGVTLGAQTYSFRQLDRPAGGDMTDVLVKAFTECGLRDCELWSPMLEPAATPPAKVAREDLRKWRLETPLDHFTAIRKKFNSANIAIRAYNYSFNDSFTEPEIDRGFEMARALGAEFITASSTLTAAKRVAPFAEKHKMVVSMHNHSNVKDPNEFATPESFAAALALSKYFKINLDIGHFTAANYDAVAYLKQHHASITNLHVKDRKRDQGPNVEWGQGDTPMREVLQLLKQNKWPIAAYLEYEYKGAGTPVDEVKKGLAYMRAALA